ncbi:MAG: hypothetical protein ACOCW7_03235, partial [Bacteroidota bacterium]
ILSVILTTCEQNKSLDAKKEIDYCIQKALITTQSNMEEGLMPRNISRGQKNWNLTRISNWTSGYYPGILWKIYAFTGDTYWKDHARKYTRMLVPDWQTYFNRQDFAHTLMLSFGNGYAATSDSSYYQILMKAADLVYHDVLQKTRNGEREINAFSDKLQSPFLDHILNYRLLFWAARNGEPGYFDLAVKWVDSRLPLPGTTNNLLAKRGKPGSVSSFFGQKGFSKSGPKNTTGLSVEPVIHFSWIIYASIITYQETQEKKYLMLAERMAEIFIQKLPPDQIPGWSFDKNTPGYSIKDASAATVSASAFLQIFSLSESKHKQQFFQTAQSILTTLSSDKYKSAETNHAFLLHSTGTDPWGGEADVSLIYTDYYYLEALLLYYQIVEKKDEEILPLISQIKKPGLLIESAPKSHF